MYNKKYMTKITKREARAYYHQGRIIVLFPCLLDIGQESNSNVEAAEIDKLNDGYSYSQGKMISFDSQVDEYEQLNCNSKTGRYCAFYIFNNN